MTLVIGPFQISWSKVISEMKSKQQSPCSNCMHWPVTSWGNACSMYMHRPVTSQTDTCTYYMGSKVSSLSRIYLYSSYFGPFNDCLFQLDIYEFNNEVHLYSGMMVFVFYFHFRQSTSL
jgi:hypothetical protein